MKCKLCEQETNNPKFCTRSCAASFNNLRNNGRKTGRQRKTVYCKCCHEAIAIYRRRFCDACSEGQGYIKTTDGCWALKTSVTKGEVLTNDTQRYRRIRESARTIASKNNLLDKCSICNYSLHVECCHKRPIASYADDVRISVINDPKNLTGLCRNHHWEFDRGLLKI